MRLELDRIWRTHIFKHLNLSHRFVLSSSHINIVDVLFCTESFFQCFPFIAHACASSDTFLKLEFPLDLRHYYLLITLALSTSNSITGSHHLLLLRLLLLLTTPLLVDLSVLGMTECGYSLLLILVGMVALETLALACIARIAEVTRLPFVQAINIVIVGAEVT